MLRFLAKRPTKMGMLSMISSWFIASSAVAVPAAFDVELRGVGAVKKALTTAVDHSSFRIVSALQVKARPKAKRLPIMALLSSAGSGASDAASTSEVEVVFRGMLFHPPHLIVPEGAQIRLINDAPVPLDLVQRGKGTKAKRVDSGDSLRFAPGPSAVYRYGAKRWASAALRVDVSPKGRLIPMTWAEGTHRFELKDLKEGPARLRILIGDIWHPVPEFILRQNNTLRMVLAFEPRKEGGEKELQVRERREVPVEMDEAVLMPKRKVRRGKKRKKRRRSKRRRRRR